MREDEMIDVARFYARVLLENEETGDNDEHDESSSDGDADD